MSENQDPKASEAACSAMDFPEYEDEERWLFKDDDTDKQEDESLGHDEFLRLQEILQEDKVSSTDDSNTCQAEYTEDNDETSHSDSDLDDNVKVIIGDIKTNASMYMEMHNNLNSQADQDLQITESDNAMNPTD
ncbi:testis-specific protein TSX-like isoform X1 [Arvicanthis niloticus]|uniref:testis-specific protein TSX-like isoform X1 n=1 Tax=Arvicanthis niloticus TaxID=61156 RepID=UPI00402B0B92